MIIAISGKISSGKDTLAGLIGMAIYGQRRNVQPLPEELADKKIHRDALRFSGWQVTRFAGALKRLVADVSGCKESDLEDIDFKNSNMPPEWNRTIKDAIEFLKWKGLTTDHVVNTMSEDEIRTWATQCGFKFVRTYREFLQEVGTKGGEVTPLFWVNSLLSRYKMEPSENRHWAGHAITMAEPEPDRWPNWIIPDLRFPNEAAAIKERDGILIRINRPGTVVGTHSSETALDNYQGFDHILENNGTLEGLYEKVTELVKQLNLQQYEQSNANKNSTANSNY